MDSPHTSHSSATELPTGAVTPRKRRGPLYGEPKKPTIFSLTPTASEKLDLLAAAFSLSRSEFIEQIARGKIPVGSPSPTDNATSPYTE